MTVPNPPRIGYIVSASVFSITVLAISALAELKHGSLVANGLYLVLSYLAYAITLGLFIFELSSAAAKNDVGQRDATSAILGCAIPLLNTVVPFLKLISSQRQLLQSTGRRETKKWILLCGLLAAWWGTWLVSSVSFLFDIGNSANADAVTEIIGCVSVSISIVYLVSLRRLVAL